MAQNNKQRPSWFAKMASQMSSAQLNVVKSGQSIQETKIYGDVCRNMKNILTDISRGNIERENIVFLINPMIYMAMYEVAVDKYNRWLCYYNATKFTIENSKTNPLALYIIPDINNLFIANNDAMKRSVAWKLVLDMVEGISRIAMMGKDEVEQYNYQLIVLDQDPLINILLNITNSYKDVLVVNDLFD